MDADCVTTCQVRQGKRPPAQFAMAQEINWGSVADWVAAFGTIAASITALYLANTRVRLRGYVGIRNLVGGPGQEHPELVFLCVTNISPRSTRIITLAIRCGRWRNYRHAIIPLWDPATSHPLPHVLHDGEMGTWSFRLVPGDEWLRDLWDGFLAAESDADTLRFEVHASNARTLVLKPEAPFLKRLRAARPQAAAQA
jgi:hypothetical protein